MLSYLQEDYVETKPGFNSQIDIIGNNFKITIRKGPFSNLKYINIRNGELVEDNFNLEGIKQLHLEF